MRENKIAFNPKWLKASAIIAAKRDIRYYLNGVLVEVFEREARLVSTDGHRMLLLRRLVDGSAPTTFIVPREVIDLLKPNTKFSNVNVEFHYDAEKPLTKITMQYFDIGIQFTPIDGKYPSYTDTMNKAASPNNQIANYNPLFLADFTRAAETAFGRRGFNVPTISHNGETPGGVTYNGRDDFFGIVMPMRVGSYAPPKWTLPIKEENRKPEEALT